MAHEYVVDSKKSSKHCLTTLRTRQRRRKYQCRTDVKPALARVLQLVGATTPGAVYSTRHIISKGIPLESLLKGERDKLVHDWGTDEERMEDALRKCVVDWDHVATSTKEYNIPLKPGSPFGIP
ncbi:hypothetical protein BDQ17DRAFT_1339937 [Cyathus striatus]|nr:hypothetical protein BDQ17DRAFT_1339937 [Cyathus striatus]